MYLHTALISQMLQLSFQIVEIVRYPVGMRALAWNAQMIRQIGRAGCEDRFFAPIPKSLSAFVLISIDDPFVPSFTIG